ncbi:MAG TPA: Gfo/Idh/MocA family oxidoreductase [Polyangia bacterium]|jgi:predicted dehydrogenase|nr:Gfo/Idh/MocA family oxidoreductase [Polyangia bacterium]
MIEIGVGVVGAGPWGLNVARAFARAKGARLRVIADLDAERRARAGQTLDGNGVGVALVSDVDDVLAMSDVAAVAVAVDSPRHHAVAKRALLAGRHVLVEKPMALSVADGAELVELAARAGRVLMVGHVLLHHPGIERARAIVASGELGRILYLHATRVGFGTVRPGESVWWSIGPHDIAAAIHLFDATPTTVSATGAGYLQLRQHDVTFATLTFADGRLAHVHVSWLAPEKRRLLTVVGSHKMLTFDETDRERPLRVHDRAFVPAAARTGFIGRAGEIEVPALPALEPLLVECEHFVDCVARGGRARGDGAHALAVLRVLAAGERSMRAGGAPVEVA